LEFLKKPNENTTEIISTVASSVKLSVKYSNDIIDSFRVKSLQNHDGKTVVEFNSKSTKDSLINNMEFRY